MILIMGPAGAGKSVQGQMLVDSLGYIWMSVGALLRQEIEHNQQLKARMDQGELLEDTVVEGIVAKALEATHDPQRVILDGFPRDHHQARWLMGFCAGGHYTIDCVLHLVVDLEVAKERILIRGRQDDHEEAINRRFHEYENVTKPILEYYDKNQIEVFEIDGGRSITEVHEQIIEVIKSVHAS